jgi:anti-sigma-K factor RskA
VSMSTKEDNHEMEDELATNLLDRLSGALLPATGPSDPEVARLERRQLELLGLLPYELEAGAPSAESRDRLLAKLRPEDPRYSRKPVPERVVAMPSTSWRSWALPLAASLVLVVLGVLVWNQTDLIRDQRATIDRLAAELSESNVQATQLVEYEEQLAAMQEQLKLVTSKGVEVCTLHPEYAGAVASNARGTLFVASDHQKWYLRIDDLEPCPLGRAYQLWFVNEDGTAVDGGILQIQKGVDLEITSDNMPQGTVAVNVTLEPAGGSQSPSGPLVLYGNEVMRIL